uniref:Uncharacterized protein n=1 Tax=Glossina pallidipes TaxID=7398 RepID=A0A1A9ZY87_GLOPL
MKCHNGMLTNNVQVFNEDIYPSHKVVQTALRGVALRCVVLCCVVLCCGVVCGCARKRRYVNTQNCIFAQNEWGGEGFGIFVKNRAQNVDYSAQFSCLIPSYREPCKP